MNLEAVIVVHLFASKDVHQYVLEDAADLIHHHNTLAKLVQMSIYQNFHTVVLAQVSAKMCAH